MAKRYVCDCGVKVGDKGELKRHRLYNCTSGRGQVGQEAQEGQEVGSGTLLTQETSKSITDLPGVRSAGQEGSDSSSSNSPSEIQGVRFLTHPDPDPLTPIKDAVVYLDARRDYLNRWELGFVSSMSFIINSKTNGDRVRSITPDMVGKLFETDAKVKALVEREEQEQEYNRRQQHFTDMKKPDHAWCDLCEADKKDRAESVIRQEQCRAEDAAILEQTRLRKERERLEGSRKGNRPTTPVAQRVKFKRFGATPKAEATDDFLAQVRANLEKGRYAN